MTIVFYGVPSNEKVSISPSCISLCQAVQFEFFAALLRTSFFYLPLICVVCIISRVYLPTPPLKQRRYDICTVYLFMNNSPSSLVYVCESDSIESLYDDDCTETTFMTSVTRNSVQLPLLKCPLLTAMHSRCKKKKNAQPITNSEKLPWLYENKLRGE